MGYDTRWPPGHAFASPPQTYRSAILAWIFPIGLMLVTLDRAFNAADPPENSEDVVVVRQGLLIELREHQLSNRDQFIAWYADTEIVEMLRHDLSPLSPARARSYFDSIILPSSARGTCWAIHERATGHFIGSTAITDIQSNKSCYFRIVIGEKQAWGKGYGTEATALVVKEAFETLGLEQVRLEVFAHNIRAQRTYERVGFRETGRHVEWVAPHRRQLTVLEMALHRGDLVTVLTP
ncbi:MAG: GNAT family N-acetyltransferase [Thermomicrobiales bacterium]